MAGVRKTGGNNAKFLFGTLFFIIVFASLASAISTSTVTRGFSTATPAPGSSLVVTLGIAVNAPDTFYLIDETIPTGWVIANAGTGDTTQANHLKWIVLSGAANTSYQYTLTVPAAASGQYNFSGTYGFDDMVTHNILGSTSVNVAAVQTPTALAIASQPSTAMQSTAFPQSVAINIVDATGTKVSTATSTVSVAAYASPTCTVAPVTLSGTLSNAAVAGTATFSNISYASVGTIYIKATSTGLASTCSAAIAVRGTPAITAIAQQNGIVGTPLTFTATSTNPNAGMLMWSLDAAAPAGSTIDAMTGAFAWTPSVAGTYNFNVVVNDGIVPAVSSPVSITVNPAVLFFSIVSSAGAGGSVAPSGTTAVSAGGSQHYVITPDVGFILVDVLVDDVSVGAVTSYDFNNVLADHSIQAGFFPTPVITLIPQQNVSVGQAVSFTATATNPNAGMLMWSLDASAPVGSTIDAMTGAFAWTPSVAGTYNFNVIVDDGWAVPVSSPVAIVVSPAAASALAMASQPTTAQQATAFPLPVVVNINDAFGNLASAATDTVAIAAFSDSACTVPATGILSGSLSTAAASGVASFSGLSFDTIGTIYLQATSGVLTASCSSAISITAMPSPAITPIPTQNATVGAAVNFTASATNPNAGMLMWSLDASAPAGSTIDAMTGAFAWTPSAEGTYNFNVIVNDGIVPAVSSPVSVVVSAVALPPVIAEVTPVAVFSNTSTPSYTFSSTDAGTISYAGDCSSLSTSAVAGNNAVVFNALPEGLHSNCTILVTNSAGASNLLSVSPFTTDLTAPVTSVSATDSNGNAYAFGAWTDLNVSIALSATDSVSGVSAGFPKYCIDSAGICTPDQNSLPALFNTAGTWHLRFQSFDNAGNAEAIQSKIVKIMDANARFCSSEREEFDQNTNDLIMSPGCITREIEMPDSIPEDRELYLDLSGVEDSNGDVNAANGFKFHRKGISYDINIEIMPGTVIDGPLGWNGLFMLPTARLASGYSLSSGSIDIVIETGSSSGLAFSQPVKITFAGMAGKKAAFSNGTTLSEVAVACTLDANGIPTNLSASGTRECFVDDGANLVIWTLHFTSFAAFTPAPPAPPAATGGSTGGSGGGGFSGGGGGSSLPASQSQPAQQDSVPEEQPADNAASIPYDIPPYGETAGNAGTSAPAALDAAAGNASPATGFAGLGSLTTGSSLWIIAGLAIVAVLAIGYYGMKKGKGGAD